MHKNAKRIWDILINGGCTEAGAAGVLGNMEAESGLESCRMEGDFTNGYTASKEYARRVDTSMTAQQFAYDTYSGGQSFGWGICQWTFWERRLNLYNYLKSDELSIGDLDGQVLFFLQECVLNYPAVWAVISKTESVMEASDAVLLKYERPADMYNKMQARAQLGQKYYDTFAGSEAEEPAETEEPKAAPEVPDDSEFVPAPIRILKYGMSGLDVRQLQRLLKAMGFDIGRAGTDGIFGNATKNAVIAYQKSVRIKADGVVGADTFNAMWRV